MLIKEETEDASSQGNTFRKTLTMAKRVIASANNTPYYRVSCHHSRQTPLPALPAHCCMFTDADTSIEQEFLLGHSINDPCFLRAEYTYVV
jgi:hypothetical protein